MKPTTDIHNNQTRKTTTTAAELRNDIDRRKAKLFVEIRKIAHTGGGPTGNRSFMITLPKNFTRVLDLKLGTPVSIQLKGFESAEPYLILKRIDLHDEGSE